MADEGSRIDVDRYHLTYDLLWNTKFEECEKEAEKMAEHDMFQALVYAEVAMWRAGFTDSDAVHTEANRRLGVLKSVVKKVQERTD
eukprot:CAMPEP_0119143946 /NCGR_PEP_ID=MMETSP1310-20130426/35121_1 /TAXON_ID=464262 /ORGANISM="Genus nov. species nov., Strain RCC2339" /LENGTH=85 /DNA_ID=CAMNT_0007135615 /DNA_START=15 /DNA_END=269 /DNA_ORIENTATION=-